MKDILLACLGASIGSFLGVLIDRFPHSSLIFPASHCNHCHHKLKAWDLVPILSQFFLGFRCRYCQAPIPRWYACLELLSAYLVLAIAHDWISFPMAILGWTSLILAIYDCKHKAYPFLVWGALTFIILLVTRLNLLFLILLLLAYLAEKFSEKIGSGDFLYLASLSLLLDLGQLAWVVQIASILGICYILFFGKKQQSIPFIPFLFVGFLGQFLL